jgi:hypothetical protein
MLRRLIKVILARKRDASGWRVEARRWERLYHAERAHSRDLLDKVLQVTGAGTIQAAPAAPSVQREPQLEELTDQEFEARMEAEEVEMWASRAKTDLTARAYLEGLAITNPVAQRALEQLRYTDE